MRGTIVAHSFGVTSGHRDGPLRIVRENASNTDPFSNWLLASLGPTLFGPIRPFLERVTLERKQILFRAHERPRFVYFPTTAVVSLVGTLDSGATLEVGLTGRDGIVGAVALPNVDSMPCDGIVQIRGVAHRLDAAMFRQALKAYEPTCRRRRAVRSPVARPEYADAVVQHISPRRAATRPMAPDSERSAREHGNSVDA